MKLLNAIDWYNYIAKRNGGYKFNVAYKVEGESAEDIFEEELIKLIEGKIVLDAGCGHGEFTLKMSKYAKKIIGFDFANELIKIAEKLKIENQIKNVEFLPTTWGEDLTFEDEYFDVIYSRRGPGSIVEQSNLLKSGGIITGIHTYPILDGEITERIKNTNNYTNITTRVFQNAIIYFENEEDYAEYLSSSHMAPDYTLPENKEEFKKILQTSYIKGRIGFRESKQIWQATKK